MWSTLRKESKSWVKTWGVYLGLLGALIAVPKEGLDLVRQLWLHPDTSVQIREVTIYHDPSLSSEIVSMPLVLMNLGNRDDVLFNNGASLKVGGQSMELTDADFGVFDNGQKIGSSLLLPKDALRAYDVSITFNSRTRPLAATPGLHTVELRFLGVKKSYSASFCFPLEATDVEDLFESKQYKKETLSTKCPGRS
jgi:hypothetical protein